MLHQKQESYKNVLPTTEKLSFLDYHWPRKNVTTSKMFVRKSAPKLKTYFSPYDYLLQRYS